MKATRTNAFEVIGQEVVVFPWGYSRFVASSGKRNSHDHLLGWIGLSISIRYIDRMGPNGRSTTRYAFKVIGRLILDVQLGLLRAYG